MLDHFSGTYLEILDRADRGRDKLILWEDVVRGHLQRIRVQNEFLSIFCFGFIQIGLFWAVMNLIPVYPLDGGQIAHKSTAGRRELTSTSPDGDCCHHLLRDDGDWRAPYVGGAKLAAIWLLFSDLERARDVGSKIGKRSSMQNRILHRTTKSFVDGADGRDIGSAKTARKSRT